MYPRPPVHALNRRDKLIPPGLYRQSMAASRRLTSPTSIWRSSRTERPVWGKVPQLGIEVTEQKS